MSAIDLPPITGSTRLFAIVGDPIAQVRSPEMFNALFRAGDVDAVLVPIQVAAADLDEVLPRLQRLGNLGGMVITVPHKIAASRHVDVLLPNAQRVGAINAMARGVDGRWSGEMFDGHGFVAGLRAAGFEPRGRAVHLAGCGGAGRAVAHALGDAGARALTLFDVDPARSEALARQLASHHPGLSVDAAPLAACDLAVNATPLGMASGDPLPFDPDALPRSTWIADMVMKPEITPLLEAARRSGHPIHLGRHTLEHQVRLVARFFGAIDDRR